MLFELNKNRKFVKNFRKIEVKRERFKRGNLHKNQCKINFVSENAVGGKRDLDE